MNDPQLQELQELLPHASVERVNGVLTTRATKEKVPVCDFCSALNTKPVVAMFEASGSSAANLLLEGKTTTFYQESVGNWAACEECAAFIRAYDKDGLLKHACALSKLGLTNDEKEFIYGEGHTMFWRVYTGNELPLEGQG